MHLSKPVFSISLILYISSGAKLCWRHPRHCFWHPFPLPGPHGHFLHLNPPHITPEIKQWLTAVWTLAILASHRHQSDFLNHKSGHGTLLPKNIHCSSHATKSSSNSLAEGTGRFTARQRPLPPPTQFDHLGSSIVSCSLMLLLKWYPLICINCLATIYTEFKWYLHPLHRSVPWNPRKNSFASPCVLT